VSAESATASFEVAAEHNGERLDRVVARLLPEYSRARIQRWIKDGEVLLNGAAVAARHGVRAGDHIVVSVSHAETEPAALPEALPLDICYQDQSLLVIEKPAGLVMHIGPGNYTGTLQNGLLHFDPGLNESAGAQLVGESAAEAIRASCLPGGCLRCASIRRHGRSADWPASGGSKAHER